jgi:NO-binding membrane sensor protein with MHYT domain
MMLNMITHWFVDASMDLDHAMPSEYDLKLVTLSIIVPSLAGYAALNITERIRAGNKMISEYSWLSIGALAMGSGAWAMHFIAMLALQFSISVNYDIKVTLVSIISVILASWVTLHVISRETCSGWQLITGGVLMGAGIGVMHYTGMTAMRMDALMRFNPWIFALSIIVAVILSILALYVNWLSIQKSSGSKNLWITIAAALVMGFAVSGMHYTGMSAAYFFPSTTGLDINAMDTNALGSWVALASILITISAFGMTIFEKRMASTVGTASVSRSRLIEAIESISDVFALFDTEHRLALMNSKYLDLMQLGSRESVVGESFQNIMCRIAKKGVIKASQRRVL